MIATAADRARPLLLACAIVAALACAAAQPASARSFVLFDGLAFKDKPDLTAFGLMPIRIAYTAELWTTRKGGDQPDEAAVKKVAASADPAVPLVLDVEHWLVQGDTPAVAANIDKLVRMVAWVHEANPAVKVGFYGLAPISNFWKQFNYARVTADPTLPNAAAFRKAYRELQDDDSRMSRLAGVVDFVCPVLYTFGPLAGGNAQYRKSWDIASANLIREAKAYGKPVYAFLWPQFYDVTAAGGDHDFIPADFWRHELEFVRANGAQAAIVWGSTTFRRDGWNESDPWWAETKTFLGR